MQVVGVQLFRILSQSIYLVRILPTVLHLRDQLVDRFFQNVEKRLGIEADPETEQDQGNQGGNLPDVQILQGFVFRIAQFAEHGSLV